MSRATETTASTVTRASGLTLPLGPLAGALLLATALALLIGGLRQAAAFEPAPDLVDFYPVERNAQGEYHFAYPAANLFWRQPLPPGARLTLSVQSPAPLPPRELVLHQRGAELLRVAVGDERRNLHLLLPPGDPALRGYALDLATGQAQAPGDVRALGLRFTAIELAAQPPAPPVATYALAATLLAATAALVVSLGLGWAAAGLAALVLTLIFRADAGRFWLLAGGLSLVLGAARLSAPQPVRAWAAARRPWPPAAWAAAAVGAGFCALIGSYALTNQRYFGTNGYDLGLYDQTLWLISRLMPNYSTGAGITMIGSHAALALYPLAALYWLIPDVRALLLFQVLAVALAVVPLYLLGRERGVPWLGVAAGLAYLAHPATQNMALFDFHLDSVAASALLCALWAAEARRPRLLIACCVLVVLCKENFAITTAWLGLWLALRGQRRLGLALTLSSIAWFLFATQWLVPALIGKGASLHVSRFAHYGDTLPAIAWFALTNPLVVLRDMLAPGSGSYLFALLAPFAFLPLLSPYVLLALPALAINLLSAFDGQRSLFYHYDALIVAVLAAAALDAAARLARLAGAAAHARSQGAWRNVLHATPRPAAPAAGNQLPGRPAPAPAGGADSLRNDGPAGLQAPAGPLGDGSRQNMPHTRWQSWASAILAALLIGAAWQAQGLVALRRSMVETMVARDGGLVDRRVYMHSLVGTATGVSAQTGFHPHLSQRQQIFIYPNPFLRADFYDPAGMPFTPQIDQILLDVRRIEPGSVTIAEKVQLYRELEARGLYRRAADLGGIVLFERVPGAPAHCYGPGWAAVECRIEESQ